MIQARGVHVLGASPVAYVAHSNSSRLPLRVYLAWRGDAHEPSGLIENHFDHFFPYPHYQFYTVHLTGDIYGCSLLTDFSSHGTSVHNPNLTLDRY